MNPPLAPLSKEALTLKVGIYEHYKGGRYDVIGVARNTETLEEFVVYRALLGDKELWVRPLRMFLEFVFVEQKGEIPRFRYIGG